MKRYNHKDYPMDMEEDENGYWVTYDDVAHLYQESELWEEMYKTSVSRIDSLSDDYNQSRATLSTQVTDLEISYNESLLKIDQFYQDEIKLYKFLSVVSIGITLIVLSLSLFHTQQLI
jgi:regulatory protein YycH of two-component signal transduction system YycFG